MLVCVLIAMLILPSLGPIVSGGEVVTFRKCHCCHLLPLMEVLDQAWLTWLHCCLGVDDI